jgi:hypothetical protein
MRKIKITETQLEVLTVMVESTHRDAMVSKLKQELDAYYSKTVGTEKKGGEYFDKPMIQNEVSGEMISPKALYDYLCYKHKGLDKEFIETVIRDWYDGNKGNKLSKNVKM